MALNPLGNSSISEIFGKSGLKLSEAPVEEILKVLKASMAAGLSEANDFRAVAQEIQSRFPLKILVWGPGESGKELYSKRVQIRDSLNNLGHEARFSEEVLKPDVLRGLNLLIAEWIQVNCYDYIVCLMASPGSIGEVHDFAINRDIATKMMICADAQHQSGYSAVGALGIFQGYHGVMHWFKVPEDLTQCHLLTRVVSQVGNVVSARQHEMMKGLTNRSGKT